jgi:hypothetical protein
VITPVTRVQLGFRLPCDGFYLQGLQSQAGPKPTARHSKHMSINLQTRARRGRHSTSLLNANLHLAGAAVKLPRCTLPHVACPGPPQSRSTSSAAESDTMRFLVFRSVGRATDGVTPILKSPHLPRTTPPCHPRQHRSELGKIDSAITIAVD